MSEFKQGDAVIKSGGDYIFEGVVVAAFTKLSGVQRYVVEDSRGILHVYSTPNLKLQEVKDESLLSQSND